MEKRTKITQIPDEGQPNFIKIEKGGIAYGFRVIHKQEGNGWITHIPAYDILLSAPSREEAVRRADIMVTHFYDYYIQTEGWKKFIVAIHKLGFQATNHATAMNRLLSNARPPKTKFNYTPREESNIFGESDVESENMVRELAV